MNSIPNPSKNFPSIARSVVDVLNPSISNPPSSHLVAVANRFDLSQFQPQNNLPAFTPRSNFLLELTDTCNSSSPLHTVASVPSAVSDDLLGTGHDHLNLPAPTASSRSSDCIIGNPVAIHSAANHTITTSSQLNRTDITELHHHHHLLTPTQNNTLRTIERKQQLHPQRYRDDYLAHSMILLLANGWSSANRYSLCSVPNPVNRSGQCKLHKYCPYCSYIERGRALCRYVPAFNDGTWHFLTGSFTGDLTMHSPADYYELINYWDSYKFALQELVRLKLVRGVFWTEELAVNTLLPVHTLPHVHCIIETDTLDEETLNILRDLVCTKLKAALGPDYLIPNLKTKLLSTQRNLLNHLQYTIKPIQIARAYRSAWSQAQHNHRAGVVQLNSEATDLVLGYSMTTKDRVKIHYAGNLSPKTRNYIGTKERDLKDAEEVVSEVIRSATDYIELGEHVEQQATTNN